MNSLALKTKQIDVDETLIRLVALMPYAGRGVRKWPRCGPQTDVYFPFGVITTSTRRLRARPSSVLLSATGCDLP